MTDQLQLHFGQWLKGRRKALDLTQKSLAQCAGCSPKTVEKIESGERRPSRQIAELLLACLQAPAEEREALLVLARADLGVVSSGDASSTPSTPLPNNLPAPLTAFIGREKEVDEIAALLDSPDTRLVTLVGPPGIGKTRLAIRVAEGMLYEDDRRQTTDDIITGNPKSKHPEGTRNRQFQDGIFFVSLAAVREPDLVAPAVAQALGVRESGTRPLIDGLKAHLHDKRALILFDNFEQIVSAAPIVTDLLSSAQGIKAIVTSREALHLYGERVYPVPPMQVPGAEWGKDEGLRTKDQATASLSTQYSALSAFEAVRLFVDRASAVQHGFALSEISAPQVVDICRRLDGLPLAIELAAARVGQFDPGELQARLENKLDLLAGGPRDLPARQRTLRGAIDWSHSLLDERERALFRRLAVFTGGCTPQAASAVFGAGEMESGDPGQGPRALAGKSLLAGGQSADGTERYRMLEMINEYAWEQLTLSGEKEAIERGHAEFYLALAEEAEPKLSGAEQGLWLDRLEEEYDNLRAALRWLLKSGPESALRLCAALAMFWYRRGHLSEGRSFLAAALSASHAAPDATLARVFNSAGTLAYAQGDFGEAERFYRESLSANTKAGDRTMAARALNNLGLVASNRGDYPAARTLYEESLTIWHALDDKAGTALSLNNLMAVALAEGDYQAARSIAERSVALREQLGDKAGLASSLSNLGIVMLALGEAGEAQALQERSLGLRTELGDRHGIAISLLNLGEIARYKGDYEETERLSQECLTICRELGDKSGAITALMNLGHVAHHRGDLADAATFFRSSLEVSREIGDRRSVAHNLSGIAGVAGSQGQAKKAAVLFGAVDRMLQAIGSPPLPQERQDYERDIQAARAQLDQSAWDDAWQRGQEMEQDEAAQYALVE